MIVSLPSILSSRRRYSGTAYDWTSRTSNTSDDLRGVGYDGSTYWTIVSASGSGVSDICTSTEIITSRDGIAWVLNTGGFSNMWDLKAADDFLIVVGNGGVVKTSFS